MSFTGFQSFGIFAAPGPRVTAGSLTFTSTHRVIYRVHSHAAVSRPDPSPTVSSCLTHRLEAMVRVRHGTYRGDAIDQHLPQFTGRHFQHRVFFFFICKLGISAGTSRDRSALTRL